MRTSISAYHFKADAFFFVFAPDEDFEASSLGMSIGGNDEIKQNLWLISLISMVHDRTMRVGLEGWVNELYNPVHIPYPHTRNVLPTTYLPPVVSEFVFENMTNEA